mgnify:CR=1 FL=1
MTRFEQENPDAQYSDFVSAFGPPKDFVEQMLSCVDGEAVEAVQRRRRYIKQATLIGLALVLLVVAVFGVARWSKAREVIKGDFHVIMQPTQQFSEEEFNAKIEEG